MKENHKKNSILPVTGLLGGVGLERNESLLDKIKSRMDAVSSVEYNDDPTGLRCNRNESPFDLPVDLKAEILDDVLNAKWNRYFTSFADDLAIKIAEHHSASSPLGSEQVLVVPGTFTIITLIISLLREKNTKVILQTPTFGHYEHVCKVYRKNILHWKNNSSYEYCLKEYPEYPENCLSVLVNPGNPIGKKMTLNQIESLVSGNPSHLFLVDEAYADFGSQGCLPLVKKCSNLLVIRTLSKKVGLPSARIGYLVSNRSLVSSIKKVVPQFSFSPFSVACGMSVFGRSDHQNWILKCERMTEAAKTKFVQRCASMKPHIEVIPSCNSFTTLKIKNHRLALRVKKNLDNENIKIAKFFGSESDFAYYFRVSTGTVSNMDYIAEALLRVIND